MYPTSILKYTTWMFVTAVAISLGNCLAQETPHLGEINSNDCSDQIYPNVNITSDPSYTDVNTFKRMTTHNPSVILTCYEFYPVEWVFQERPSNDVVLSLRERRGWSSSRNGKLHQQFLIDVTLNLTSHIHNITCRAIEERKACRQTTVQFVKANVNGINTTDATVHKGLPRGETLQQYSMAYEDNNIICSLHIIYDHGSDMFECFSKNNDSIVSMQKSDMFRADLCYDPFSCGLLYNKNARNYCRNKFKKDESFIRETLDYYERNWDINTGIVTCSQLTEPEKNGQGTENLQKATVFSHFFRAKDMYCNGTGEWEKTLRRQFHVDVDPWSLSDDHRKDFIRFCGLERPFLIHGHKLNVSCHTSVYLFAEGVQMKIIMQDGSESNVTDISLLYVDNPLKIKKDGYHVYLTTIIVNSMQISAISCSAPLRKSERWIVKTTFVSVRYPIPLQFEGNKSETIIVNPDSDVLLRCEARGSPHPRYEWKDSASGSKFPGGWIGHGKGFSEGQLKIPFRNISSFIDNPVVCVARNIDEHIEKTFSFDIGKTSDYFGESWSAIVIPASVIALIVVGGTFAFLVWKIIHQRKNLRLLSQVEIEEFMNGNPDVLNNSRGTSEYDINSYSTFLPYNQNFEVLKEQIELDMSRVIGSGAYGIVLKGVLSISYTEKVQVAIKTSKPMDDVSYLKALMSELKIMGYIGKHDNIVNLLGAYTKNLQNKEIFIAIEYCDNGCLLNYLRSHRERFVDQLGNGKLQSNVSETYLCSLPDVFSTTTLLKWCMQISNGMNFLSLKKVIHGDIAARNILLSLNLTAKIGDFGLSRQLFEYANYVKKQKSPLPWKWLAIECLQDMKFSPQSDVWAYGITLWEIFTIGNSPFPGCSYDKNFIDSLVGGLRPEQPKYATLEWHNLMKKCWETNPLERPSFTDISEYFDDTIRRITHEEYINIDPGFKMYSVVPAEGPERTDVDMPEEGMEVGQMDVTQDKETVISKYQELDKI